MPKFRKKPVVIEAIQLTKSSIFKTLEFIGDKVEFKTSSDYERFSDYCGIVESEGLKIETLEGVMTATIGDWIIKGINGEFYPCKPDIFEKTYEQV